MLVLFSLLTVCLWAVFDFKPIFGIYWRFEKPTTDILPCTKSQILSIANIKYRYQFIRLHVFLFVFFSVFFLHLYSILFCILGFSSGSPSKNPIFAPAYNCVFLISLSYVFMTLRWISRFTKHWGFKWLLVQNKIKRF